MATKSLPREVRGNWIWSEHRPDEVESYAFFRREFTLDEIPSSAELWIAARSFFHVFVNGYHVSYGLGTCPTRGSYVWQHDIAYLLGTGVNNVAVLAHNTTVSRSCCHRQPSGLWCQVNIDEKPEVWTGPSWKVLKPKCYLPNRPRRSLAAGFTEKVDLSQFPHGWTEREFKNDHWIAPSLCVPVDPQNWELVPFNAPEMTVDPVAFSSLILRGECHKTYLSSNVSFELMLAERGRGVYGAETYFQVGETTELSFEFYSDNPYRLFINGKCIKEQGVRTLNSGEAYESCRSLAFRQTKIASPEGRMLLERGWNHLVFYTELEKGSSGVTLVFPDHHADALHLYREPLKDALPGWTTAGPLRTPLANMLGNLTLNLAETKEHYIPVEGRCVDEGAELMSYDFTSKPGQPANLTEEEVIELKEGDYVIVSVPASTFGCPRISISGTRGDIVDVVSGNEIADGQLVPWEAGRENVDTLILGQKPATWMAVCPRGLRYLMIVARQARGTIQVAHPQIKVRRYDFDNPGMFESSDMILNRIWSTGRRTLAATVQEAFIDSPCKDETQYIADAMIQSWASYHVSGNFNLAAKSLEEFAKAQFETGEIPAACPSDIYYNIPDYSLLWPVWLQRHYMHSGDKGLLGNLIPHLQKLFSYYAELAAPGQDVLADLGDRFGAFCFLDHGEIDRRGTVTGLNSLYCRSLLCGVSLLEAVGRDDDARQLRDLASRVAHQIRELTWDEEKGLFADSYHNGARSNSYSMQTNVLAIYGGVAPSSEYARIFDLLFSDQPPFVKGDNATESMNPYFKYFILETAFALGRRNWALDLIRWYWKGMLEHNAKTWWEIFDPNAPGDNPYAGTSCHGYGVSPNAFLISEVVGIRPAKAGFTTVYFNPLTSGVHSVKAKIPTPYGQIMVEWELKEGNQLEAIVDANYPLAVIPELEPGIAESAVIHVSDEVSIFASE
jgi:hypothetical protein